MHSYHRIRLLPSLILQTLTAVFLCLLAPLPLSAQETTDTATALAKKLEQVPAYWNEKVEFFTQEEYEGTLQYWADTYPEFCDLERRGVTNDGYRLFMLKVTDEKTSDEDKQVCLITALHGGPERTGTTSVLKLTEWLLGDSEEAKQTRERQIVLIMPVMHPRGLFVSDRFQNQASIDPYTGGSIKNWDFNTMTYLARDDAPEVAAFLDVVDEYQPEVVADVHGIGLQEIPDDQLGDRKMSQGMTMFEVTGSAYSNFALRPWDWRITERLNAAGEKGGYGYDRFEADAQRLFHGDQMAGIADKTWSGRANFYTAQYAYAKYHSLVLAFEVGWEESGLLRLKELLRIGNESWQGEPNTGYPVDRVKNFIGHFVVAYGDTASARRKSRVELWNRQKEFSQGVLYPQTIGRDSYFIGAAPRTREIFKEGKLESYLENLTPFKEVQSETLKVYVEAGPELKLATIIGAETKQEEWKPIEGGMSLRFRLPYQDPKLIDVRLNGHELEESRTDGYQAWRANGFTQVQINIPPEKTQSMEVMLGTVAYDSQQPRPQGWDPPASVRQKPAAE
ncbi:Zinc carboxypeptidase [Polystyrenella longa]|uniref:Zinc carboxypeptidase n=1 Tax=Polystyrenella longa TaxID=2528007 RepID=A0A518CH34_9PLAN|nr:M14 family zinc carboxypeptidase [Polystyrenella longa]QDU78539.1 Zinc carboxypeptidase [Polystyrenella longa]